MSPACGCSAAPAPSLLLHPLRRHPPPPPPLTPAQLFSSYRSFQRAAALVARASVAENSADFAKRMEQAWLISQQPRPIACSSCASHGIVECKWCRGTGFFILGDNMLCEVPSKNTTCKICSGKGSICCSDCKGTGFRAKWLGEPPPSSE